MWRRDGSELFYRHEDSLMAVPVRRAPGFSVGPPRRVLDSEMVFNVAGNPGYDVMPDGRFVGLMTPGQADPSAAAPIVQVVLNWFEELKRLAPVPSGRKPAPS